MTNKILKIALTLSIVTLTFLQAENKNENIFHNSTINIPSSSSKDKVFIREYKYNASDTDSKVSSRKKAIAQLKSILSEEVGVHIESSLEMKNTVRNGVNDKYFKSEINQLSASITKLKILDEEWNGVTYYIKASVKVNEEQTMKLLLEAIKAKASKKDVIRLNKILKEQNGNLDKSYTKIKELQRKLVLQEIKNQASKNELTETQKILDRLKKEIIKYDIVISNNEKLEKKYNSKLAEKKRIIKKLNLTLNNQANKDLTTFKQKKEILCSFDLGSTFEDVIRISQINLTRHSAGGNTHAVHPSQLLRAKGVGYLGFKFQSILKKYFPRGKNYFLGALLVKRPYQCDKKIKIKF